MAKKKEASDETRQTRKEILLARKQQQEKRRVSLIVGGIVGLILVIVVAAVVVEYSLRPSQAVAIVNGETITLRQWQSRVRFQRAQIIIGLESIAESLGGDIGQVQQFAGQQISLLLPQGASQLGQGVLDQLIDEALIRQEASRRGITVSDAEVDEAIGEQFLYFGGDSPTPFPTATATIAPTPSLTPLPTPVITDVLPTATPSPTVTPGPTSTPRPTATPVSEESFREQLAEQLDRLQELGVAEATFREIVRAGLYQERIVEALAAEADLPTEALHVSYFSLTYDDEELANQALVDIASRGYLTVWNEARSAPPPADPETAPPVRAGELVWRTEAELQNASIAPTVVAAVFSLDLNTPSDILRSDVVPDTPQFLIVMVSGRENQPLTESELNAEKQAVLNSWLATSRSGVSLTELWRGRVPASPALDPRFLEPPTPVPGATLGGATAP